MLAADSRSVTYCGVNNGILHRPIRITAAFITDVHVTKLQTIFLSGDYIFIFSADSRAIFIMLVFFRR